MSSGDQVMMRRGFLVVDFPFFGEVLLQCLPDWVENLEINYG
jgi:hypothetical protein